MTACVRKKSGTIPEPLKVTKWVASVLRKKLQLRPYKSHGVFVVPMPDASALARLFEKYGLSASEGPDLDGLDAGMPPAAPRTAAEGNGGHGDVGTSADGYPPAERLE